MSKKAKGKDERSNLLSASIDSSQLDSYSEYTATDSMKGSNCNFDFVAANKKPLIAISIIVLVGFSATLTMLYLDHEGFWDKPNPIDKLWFTQTLTNTTSPQGLYPLWFESATNNGELNNNNSLYKSQYGQAWNSDENQNYNYSTLITQSQLIYNFATAFAITRNITYYETMINGVNIILNKFIDNENGGYYYSINETINNTAIINDNKNSIAHSTFIYAISTAFIVTANNQITQKELYLQILNSTYDLFHEYFCDEYGGIYDNLSINWNQINENNNSAYKSQLSLMYYFEAMSQLLRVAKNIDGPYLKLLSPVVIKRDIILMYNFVCDLLDEYKNANINYYVLYERYDLNWSEPLNNANISLGAAYKWSYLISYFIDENIIVTNRDYALLFLQYAIDLGYDKELQRIHDTILNENNQFTNAPYWTVCNALKTLYYYWDDYSQQNNDDWLDILKNIIVYYQTFYYDQQYGGIYYSKPNQLWKGNVSKVDYQCIDMTLYVTQLIY